MPWSVDPKKANQLNIRVAPKPGAVLATLPAGARVDKLSEHSAQPVWWNVEANLNDQVVRGFVHSAYLREGLANTPAVVAPGAIPPLHLETGSGRRNRDGGRAFPLNEPGMPTPGAGSAAKIIQIIQWLDPGAESHSRYQAGGGKTYCNIYAYDFAQRCGAFIPRVWWKDGALRQINGGTIPPVLYGQTVREMNANMLHDWFIEYGQIFGWRRTFDLSESQATANAGSTCIIVAKRKNLARSGHIAAVVPEHGPHEAKGSGTSIRPVQSQAGSTNHTAKVPSTRWWLRSTFQSFGFWVHD